MLLSKNIPGRKTINGMPITVLKYVSFKGGTKTTTIHNNVKRIVSLRSIFLRRVLTLLNGSNFSGFLKTVK